MKISYITKNPHLTIKNINKLNKIGELTIIDRYMYDVEHIIKMLKNTEILLISPNTGILINSIFLRKLEYIKYISLMSTGFDYADIDYIQKRKIMISNSNGSNSVSVSEYIWGMILNLTRKISNHDRFLRSKTQKQNFKFEGFELKGKTLGILGTGNIGVLVAKLGKSFGMKTIGFNKSGLNKIFFDKIDNLKEVISVSDIIVISLPKNEQTINIINKKILKYLKPGSIIVNVSRDKIVDKNAILECLEKGKLYGYGADVDTLSENDMYFKYENVIITVHNAYNTKESKIRTENISIKNIINYISGNPTNLLIK